MASFGYTFRKAWRKKRDDLRQAKYTREHDVLFKRKGATKVLFIFMFVILTIFVVSFLFPFAWILMNSFKQTSEFGLNMMGWPKQFTFQNFIDAFTFKDSTTQNKTIIEMLGMTILIAGVGTIVTVFTSTCAAYVVAKYKFFGRNVIFTVVIFSLIVPIVGSLPSQMQMMKNVLHLNNTVIGCIFIYSGGFGANFLLLYSFFKNLSWTYVEAAKVDGANDFVIFFRIIIPMAKGPIIAISIIQLIGLWNDYQTPSIYLPKYPTLAVGLQFLFNKMEMLSYPMMFATIIIAILPILILFAAFSKTIMENTSVGGLKGQLDSLESLYKTNFISDTNKEEKI